MECGMNKDCQECQDMMVGLEWLTAEEIDKMENHLKNCKDCRQQQEILADFGHFLADVPMPVDVNTDITGKVMEKIGKRSGSVFSGHNILSGLVGFILVECCCLFVLKYGYDAFASFLGVTWNWLVNDVFSDFFSVFSSTYAGTEAYVDIGQSVSLSWSMLISVLSLMCLVYVGIVLVDVRRTGNEK